jgi:hypothetical protein
MKRPRVGTSIHIGGQAPKHLGPRDGVASWTLCAGIGYDEVAGKTIHAPGCPERIDQPRELGTLQPRSPQCYRAHIDNVKTP